MAQPHLNDERGIHIIRSFPLLGQRQSNHGLLMTHAVSSLVSSNATSNSPASVDSVNVNMSRNPSADSPRIMHNNIYSVIEGLRPLVEHARTVENRGLSLSSWLRQPPAGEHSNVTVDSATTPDSIVITLENEMGSPSAPLPDSHSTTTHTNHIHHHAAGSSHGNTFTDNLLNNIREAASNSTASSEQNNANNNNNNNNPEEGAAEILRQSPETRALLSFLYKYVPFLLILLGKGIYDHRAGILIFVALFVTFSHANSVVKREIAKQGRRSLVSLFVIVCNLCFCILFIYYIFQDQKLYLSMVFIPPYSQPLSVWDLLWIVGVTDFVLKLITILLKTAVAAFPAVVLPYQKRGKCYLFLEATSQFYRSLTPIQPWLYYLLESYQGPEKVVGVFLSAAYMVFKGSDLLAKGKLWKESLWKLLQNMNLGVSPNKDQLHLAGNQCPICHDEYEAPVLLHCRHIFCEACVATWFDRVQTCPLCRAKVVDDPSWRDGTTTYFTQFY